MKSSELSFVYAYPLDQSQRTLYGKQEKEYPSIDEVRDAVISWENVWKQADTKYKIISTISELTRRVPKRNLECFVFGSGMSAMSTPFLIPVQNKRGELRSDEEFIEIVIHELLHIFLITDNATYWQAARKQFEHEEPVCVNHIVLYAMLYEIYQKLFDKEPLDFNREKMPKGYARAVSLVKEVGYKKLISEYQSLA